MVACSERVSYDLIRIPSRVVPQKEDMTFVPVKNIRMFFGEKGLFLLLEKMLPEYKKHRYLRKDELLCIEGFQFNEKMFYKRWPHYE